MHFSLPLLPSPYPLSYTILVILSRLPTVNLVHSLIVECFVTFLVCLNLNYYLYVVLFVFPNLLYIFYRFVVLMLSLSAQVKALFKLAAKLGELNQLALFFDFCFRNNC